MTTNTECEIWAVMPLAWGAEALTMTLAAMQAQMDSSAASGRKAAVKLLLLAETRCDNVAELVRQAGIDQLVWVLHSHLAAGVDNESASWLAAQALPELLADAPQTLVLLPPGAQGEALSARLAQRLGHHALDARCLGRCSEIEWRADGFAATRSAWGGRMNQQLVCATPLALATCRGGKVQPRCADQLEQRELLVEIDLPEPLVVESESSGEQLPPLEGARLVVSGGRGVNETGFQLLEQLARLLDASLGGSLPAVDAGCVPVMRQVGISGKFVSADTYLAVGISGTPQHMAGISPETRILAVNKDANADIFRFATAGCVADWEQLLPELLEVLDVNASATTSS